jgi:copper chaperone CopZ
MDTAALDSVEITIENMTCDNCVRRVRSALEELPGVESVEASLGSARVMYYPQVVSPRAFRERLGQVGYPVPTPGASKKGFLGRWIDRMAASNRATFGTEALDCCKLNKNSQG